MQYTENYNLNKPELTDVADITKLSDNMDIIDEELEKRTTKLGFLTDLITHLASDAAIAISSLSTDSVFYRLLQYALNAAGVQYNFQNSSAWYICLGALFGGLIIQGGESNMATGTTTDTVSLPISFPSGALMAIPVDVLTTGSPKIMGKTFTANVEFIANESAGAYKWLAIGY